MSLVAERRDSPQAAAADSERGHPAYVWVFIAFLLTDVFSGYTKNLGLPIGPDRIFFAFSLLLLALDPATSFRRLRVRPVHVTAFATVSIAGLSALAAGTLTTSLGLFALLDRLIVPYLSFCVAPLVFRRQADRVLLLKALTLLGLYLGVTAFLETFGPKGLIWPRYITNPNIGIQYGRARGPFAESESDGLAMIGCGYCALTLITAVDRRIWRRLAALTMTVCAIGALLTLTRSIWVGLVLGIAVLAVLDRRLRPYIALAAIGLAFVTGVALATSSSLRAKVDSRTGDSRSVYDRQNTDAAAIRIVEAHPLNGVGWLRFIDVSGEYVRQNPNYPVTNVDIEVHNVVLSRLAELGIPGGTLWVLSVVFGIGLAAIRGPPNSDARTWRVVLLGMLCAWIACIMLSPVPYPLPNVLVWLFAGLTLSDYLQWPDLELEPAAA